MTVITLDLWAKVIRTRDFRPRI